MDSGPRPTHHVRTIFISDVHLGSRDCRADLVLDFLRRVHTDQLILVGDIIDVWSLKRSFYWPQSHSDVLRTILGKTKHGTRVIFVPGNHDEQFRNVCGMTFGNMEVQPEYIHETLRGLRMLVMHGDEFDGAVQCSRWLAALGSGLYDFILRLNRGLNAWRHRLGLGYWSLAAYIKSRIGNAMKYVHEFERAAAHAARRRGVDGIVCGHIHRPEMTQMSGVLYCNDGDWVENCSALIETRSGELELWHWADMAAQKPAVVGAGSLGRAA
jgi:UDP-2,3-diacylglucosamine pyrophosphatase LpxH